MHTFEGITAVRTASLTANGRSRFCYGLTLFTTPSGDTDCAGDLAIHYRWDAACTGHTSSKLMHQA